MLEDNVVKMIEGDKFLIKSSYKHFILLLKQELNNGNPS